MERKPVIAAVVVLAGVLLYWSVGLWQGGAIFWQAPGGHDGGLCYAESVVPQGAPGPIEESAPCGVSFSPEFALALAAIVVALFASILALRSASTVRPLWIATIAAALAASIAAVETAITYLHHDPWGSGLGLRRGPIHVGLLTLVALALGRALRRVPHNAETARAPMPTPE